MRLLLCLLGFSLIGSVSLSGHANENECGIFAEIQGNSYIVEPNGGDDTDTLQCVLDSAVKQGIGTVQLAKGDFNVTTLNVVGFHGVFTGTTRADTRIFIANGATQCVNREDTVFPTALITFAGGKSAVKSMTIDADDPCTSGNYYATLFFTQESCTRRTFFGEVDRVDLVTSYRRSSSASVAAVGTEDCVAAGKGALGTFKVNRSSFTGGSLGIITSMLGGGQVDINYNDFIDVGGAISIFDANQSTTITGNEVQYGTYGVNAASITSAAPNTNRTVIHKNIFTQLPTALPAAAVNIDNEGKRANHSAVITVNTMNLLRDTSEGWWQYGVVIDDVDGVIVSGNKFNGSATSGISVDADQHTDLVVNTVITSNTFRLTSTEADILLGGGTTKSVLGPQSATYINYGLSNLISTQD